MILENSEVSFKEQLVGKTIVVDTSVLLTSGTNLLNSLEKCNLVIPSIVVKELEEKRGHATLGFLAREWLRLIEDLRKEKGTLLSEGVNIPNYSSITLQVEPNHSKQKTLPRHLQDNSNDSTILAVAYNLSEDEKITNEVVILSNDTPMRIHATLDLKLNALEYNSTLAEDVKPFNGILRVDLEDDEWLESDYVLKTHGKNLSQIVLQKIKDEGLANATHLYVQAFIKDNYKPVAWFIYSRGFIEEIEKKTVVNHVRTRSLEQDVAFHYLLEDPEILPIVSIGGGAGTGKTLLSVATALSELEKFNYEKIIVFRSLHEMGKGQELGFLPGDVKEKMEAWGGAVYDSIDVIASLSIQKTRKSSDDVKALSNQLKTKVEISPISYLRGRSLNNAFIILDEAQNFSRNELLNIISRVGENTKIVLCSDDVQVDNRFLQSGSKAEIWSVINDLKKEDLFAHITLQKTERSKVAEITSKLLEG